MVHCCGKELNALANGLLMSVAAVVFSTIQ